MTSTKELFRAWVRSAGGEKAAADALGVSIHTIRSIKLGRRGLTPEHALEIDRLSGGKYRKELLVWPDAS